MNSIHKFVTGGMAALMMSTVAAARSAPSKYLLRELIARPSAVRTVGPMMISVLKFKSCTMRRMTTVCWASFCPK